MNSTLICESCGSALPVRAPLGLCPRCLIAVGLEGPSPHEILQPSKPPGSINGTRRFGEYELLEEVARGGMGIVYRARQVSLDRIVAVKVLLFGKFSSDEFINRFRSEARVAAALQHPNIVSIHEVGEHDGQPYFSMDFVEGRDMGEIVRDGPMPPRRAAACLRTVCMAVQYSHDRGIVHRDLKPSNILIDRLDQPRITDFGLAEQLRYGPQTPTDAAVFGSPGYVSPEQADPREIAPGPASDIYSLGAILYHLLTGRLPFAAGTVEETLRQVLCTEPAPPRLLNPGIPRDLETICLKCLQKKPSQRYATAANLAEDLGRWLRGEPISARPARRLEKMWRWARREPALASVGATAILLLALGSVLVTWQWQRAEANAARYREISYADGMKAAYAEFEEGNLAQVDRLLEEQKPRAHERDLRGFEWYHLYQATHPNTFLMLPRLKQVTGALIFSPQSRYLSTYNWDDSLRLWDLEHPGREHLCITNASGPGGFSHQGDEFIAGTRDGSVNIYQVLTGKMLRSIRLGGELVAVSADGTRLVTIDASQHLQVFDTSTGKPIFTCPQKTARRSNFGWNPLVAISANGKLLASSRSASEHRAPDKVVVWDLQVSAPLAAAELFRVRCLTFSPNSEMLAIGGAEGKCLMLDTRSGTNKVLAANTLPLCALAFSPDSSILATGGSEETIRLWESQTGKPRPGILHANLGNVLALAFSPNGQWLAAGGRDTEVRLLPIGKTPVPLRQEGVISEEWGNFAFSPDGTLMAAVFKGDLLKVLNVANLALVATLPDTHFVVSFSEDNRQLLVADQKEQPLWWNFRTGLKTAIPAYSGTRMSTVDLSPDRKIAAIGHKNGTIELLEIDSGRTIATWQAHPDEVLSIAFSPQADKLVSGGTDRAVSLWNIPDHKRLASNYEHRGAVCALAFSRDGNLIASACGADTIKFWKTSEMDRSSLAPSMSFHKAQIRTLDFSPDGKTLASGADDKTMRLWNVATHQEMASFKIDSPLQLVRFSSDGETLAVITTQGTLQLFTAPNQKANQ